MFNELPDQEISIWIKANRFKMVIKVDRTVVKYSFKAHSYKFIFIDSGSGQVVKTVDSCLEAPGFDSCFFQTFFCRSKGVTTFRNRNQN